MKTHFRFRWLTVCFTWGLFFSMVVGLPAQEEKEFRAGAAMSNITPPLGESIVGGWVPRPATHIHDELHARCIVLDDGESQLVIVLCDNVGIPREVFDAARKRLHELTEISTAQMLFASTHTHSATTARSENPLDPDAEMSEYQQFLVSRIVDGVRRAINNLEPARIGWGSVDVPEEVFNRRWFMNPSAAVALRNPFGGVDQVRMNPPRASSDLLRPAGPIDPEVSFISVQSKDGEPIALLANYSLHYVGGVPSGHVSADYFAIFAHRIGQLLKADRQNPPFVGMMSNGTSGNINNINFQKRSERRGPYDKMREVAELVAQRVAEAHQKIEFHDWVPLAARYSELELSVRKPDEKMLAWARETSEKAEGDEKWHSREAIYARRVQLLHQSPETVKAPLQTLRIGDLGIAAIPFEVFVETGLELKEKSPLGRAFTISLANGSYGYLPTPEHHQLGGYETWMGTSRVEFEASTKITHRLIEMFDELAKEE